MLLQRVPAKEGSRSVQWSFFGGQVLEGETPRMAAERQCLERLSYPLSSPKLVLVHTSQGAVKHVFAERYDDSRTLVASGGREAAWVDPAEAFPSMIAEDRGVLEFLQGSF